MAGRQPVRQDKQDARKAPPARHAGRLAPRRNTRLQHTERKARQRNVTRSHQARPLGSLRNAAPAHDAKERIMEAAEELFAAQGYAATSVSQIAQSAGTNRALLYYYFRDKRDLYWAIMKGGLRELGALIAAVGESPGGPRERLEHFVRGYYELLVRRHHVVRMIFREMTGLGEQLGLPIEDNLRRVVVAVRGIIEDGLKSGEFDGIDPEVTAFWLSAMIHAFFTQRLATGRALPTDVVVAQTLSLFHRGGHAQEQGIGNSG